MEQIRDAWTKLANAVLRRRSERYCLRVWSEFIRTRDDHRCVICAATGRLSAHHILRKSFMPQARFAPGNGITLCATCHAEPHEMFNGAPDMTLPMDAQNGERIDFLMGLFLELADDATKRNLRVEKFYRLGEAVVSRLKRLQELPDSADFPGLDVERAYWIWRQTPRSLLYAIMEANGFSPPPDIVQRPGVVAIGDMVFVTSEPDRGNSP